MRKGWKNESARHSLAARGLKTRRVPYKSNVKSNNCSVPIIVEKSGYANGEKFESDSEVRAYFTKSNMKFMFGGPYEYEWTQDELDKAAKWCIEHRYHIYDGLLPGRDYDDRCDIERES